MEKINVDEKLRFYFILKNLYAPIILIVRYYQFFGSATLASFNDIINSINENNDWTIETKTMLSQWMEKNIPLKKKIIRNEPLEILNKSLKEFRTNIYELSLKIEEKNKIKKENKFRQIEMD
jgi:hypothetical protein